MVFWRKEEGKEKLEVKGGQGGILPIFSYVSRQSGEVARTAVCDKCPVQAAAHKTRACDQDFARDRVHVGVMRQRACRDRKALSRQTIHVALLRQS